MIEEAGQSKGIWFVYDGDCPLCTSAALALRIKRDYGTLHLINARQAADDPCVQEITRQGLDLDEGMAIFADGRIYHGKDALCFMARYGETQNAFMAVTRALFWSDTLAAFSYPWMRAVRNRLLRRRGFGRIDNLSQRFEPTFKPVFGADWDKLPPVLRAHYANRPYTTDEVVVEGVLDVWCAGPVRILSPLLRIMRQIPATSEKNVRVAVRFLSDLYTDAYHFDRTFQFEALGPYRFHSRMFRISGNEVVEVMPFRLGWRMRFEWDGEKIVLQHAGYALRLFGRLLPLPLGVVMGEGYAEEVPVDEDHFDMMTHITHPWWGKIYEYKGRFRITKRVEDVEPRQAA